MITQALTLAQQYNKATQYPSQMVAQFVNYLDELEAELSLYSDEHRHQHLLAKLIPELRQPLNNYQHIPDTRVELIRLATQLEANLSWKTHPDRKQSSTQRDSDPKGKRKAQGNEPNANQLSSKSLTSRLSNRWRPNLLKEERKCRTKNNLCYQYSKEGHHALKCPDRLAVSLKDNQTENFKSQ